MFRATIVKSAKDREGDKFLNGFLFNGYGNSEASCKEGDLYKVVELGGKRFELRYGYYEDCDRNDSKAEPIPIYPDLKKQPLYTDDGYLIVTLMQDVCDCYEGESGDDADCSQCKQCIHCEELFGICKSDEKRLGEKTNITDIK